MKNTFLHAKQISEISRFRKSANHKLKSAKQKSKSAKQKLKSAKQKLKSAKQISEICLFELLIGGLAYWKISGNSHRSCCGNSH